MCIRDRSIDRDSAGEKRPERQEYRALVESLPEDRQEAHLRALLVWVRAVSYTHLDVYKRQRHATSFLAPPCVRPALLTQRDAQPAFVAQCLSNQGLSLIHI